jgi:hypothetical protein
MEASGAVWRTSSHSTQDGNCIEIGMALPGRIAVRDSKNRRGAGLVFAPGQWQRFVDRLKTATLT